MSECTDRDGRRARGDRMEGTGFGPTLSRRSFFEAITLVGLGIAAFPGRDAMAWGSWSKGTSDVLNSIGLGDCMHEDITQIAYASAVGNHKGDKNHESLINPWAAKLSADKKSGEIAGNTVVAPDNGTFIDENDLIGKLYRDNVAHLRIGSYWSEAAANTVQDLGLSATEANNVPKYSGNNEYGGPWAVAEHVKETHAANRGGASGTQRDALVQFAVNERANFMHGMLSKTADGSTYLRQSDIKRYIYQWMGVAYEYARTGEVRGTNDVSQSQAQLIIDGLVDPYGQEDRNRHEMCTTLKIGDDEASKPISTRQKRLRALGMLCHTMEDLWNPAHTCRVYREWEYGDRYDYTPYTIMAFANYRKQNGTVSPTNGYHMPYDRYSKADGANRNDGSRGYDRRMSERLGSVCKESHFSREYPGGILGYKTLGLDEALSFTRDLLNQFFENKPWDGGVGDWVNKEVLRDCFDGNGSSVICDAGRRGLHSPTYLIAPIQDMKTAFSNVKSENYYEEMLKYARQFDEYQRHAVIFFVTDEYLMEEPTKYINKVFRGYEDDWGAEKSIHNLIKAFYNAVFHHLNDEGKDKFIKLLGCNGCHKAISMLNNLLGLVWEFSIDLRLSRYPNSEAVSNCQHLIDFLKSGEKKLSSNTTTQSSAASALLSFIAPRDALADEAYGSDETYVTTDMEVLDLISYDDGSFRVSVRDLGSLETAVMEVPSNASGKELLETGASNLRITYTLSMECEDDINFTYTVKRIEVPSEVPLFVIVGTVSSVSDGLLVIVSEGDGSELFLQVASDVTDVPSAGDYVCAYYAMDSNGTEHLLDYVELDRPKGTYEVTYPVVRVYGSGMWLLNTDDMSDDYYDDGVAGGKDCEDSLMYVEFGDAAISPVPQEGCMATVVYYDRDYYDGNRQDSTGGSAYKSPEANLKGAFPTTDSVQGSGGGASSTSNSYYGSYYTNQGVGQTGMYPAATGNVQGYGGGVSYPGDPAPAAAVVESLDDPAQVDVSAQQASDPALSAVALVSQSEPLGQAATGNDDEYYDDDYDSLDDPAYVQYPDEYWSEARGNEMRHIATSVLGSGEWAPSDLLLQVFGGLVGDIKHATGSGGSGGQKDTTTCRYVGNGNGTHKKYTTDSNKRTFESIEQCTYNSQGTCIYCGDVYKPTGSDVLSPSGDYLPWPRTRYPQVLGYSRPGYRGSTYRTYGDPTSSVTSTTSSGTGTATSATTGTAADPSTSSTGGLLGGYTGTGTSSTATEVAATPTTVVSTGGAATPATGTATSPMTALPNTGDAGAVLDVIMSVSAAAGVALTAHGLKNTMHGRDDEQVEEAREQED